LLPVFTGSGFVPRQYRVQIRGAPNLAGKSGWKIYNGFPEVVPTALIDESWVKTFVFGVLPLFEIQYHHYCKIVE